MSCTIVSNLNTGNKGVHKFIVIADDLTGSNDCGVQFQNYDLSTITILNKDFLNDICGFDAVVIDSETRSMTKEKAYEKVSEIGEGIKGLLNNCIVYKKIDSTLRGNIACELKALKDILEAELIVFAPAYPQNKRTTIHGIHYLNNTPVDKTELSRDPKNPVMTSDIRELLNMDSSMQFVHVDVESIRNGDICEIIKRDKSKCFSFDAAIEEDLNSIVGQVITLNRKVLWVGSAGLTGALISCLSKGAGKLKPVLAVVGSINSISAVQAKNALNDKNVKAVNVAIEKAVLNPEEEKKRLSEEIVKYMEQGMDILLASALDIDQVIVASSLGNKLSLPLCEISTKIAEFMGCLVYELISKKQVAGIFLTGGDIAVNVMKKLSAKGLKVLRELEMGIPVVSIIGGPFEGLKLITKAGAFGNENAVLNSIKYLRDNKQKI